MPRLLSLLVVAVLLIAGSWRSAGQAPPAGGTYVGVGSCAGGTGCHHKSGAPGSPGGEYTTWLVHDPHARAFETLGSGRSRLIVRNLGEQKLLPTEHPLCLSCHATVSQDSLDRKALRLDGVSCEACHGPAAGWRELHYQPSWKRLTAAEKVRLGYRCLDQLTPRAQLCAGCHIGQGEREVNHDLIAAGHPRLHFEFGAYLANYPRHWPLETDKKNRPDFEARAWLIGQIVSAQAALELLQHRAEQSAKPWPEFAEYDCFVCHHDLVTPSWRQSAQYGKGRRPGSLFWSQWYQPDADVLEQAAGKSGLQIPRQVYQDLNTMLTAPLPNRSLVARRAREAIQPLADWLARVDQARFDLQRVKALQELLETQISKHNPWDRQAQLYLSLAALVQAQHDLGEPPDAALRERVQGWHEKLAFPPFYDSPRDTRSKK